MKNVYEKVVCGGLDVHKKFSTVTMRDALGKVVRRERLDHPDRAELRRRLSAWPKGVPFVLEASFGWSWLADEMTAAGLRPMLSNCGKVEYLRKARGQVKTNKQDADLLSEMPLEKGDWWQVWLPPAEVRDQREWMRQRSALVAVQTQTKNRISALFHRHGVFHGFSDLFGTAGRKFLAQVCVTGRTADVELRPGAWSGLRGLVELLGVVRDQLARIGRELHRQLQASPLVRRLDGIPGFALILAHTLVAEVGEIKRFADHRALARYSLLAPLSDDTGEDDGSKPIGRHLGHRGNHTLKWVFLEAARAAVRHGGRAAAIFNAATDHGQRDCGRGHVKVARDLVKKVYVVWAKGVEYTETPPARPGSAAARSETPRQHMDTYLSSSRSGTGQP
jgi:transposase